MKSIYLIFILFILSAYCRTIIDKSEVLSQNSVSVRTKRSVIVDYKCPVGYIKVSPRLMICVPCQQLKGSLC
ncbi:unnamed protein product [Colias eurytheme]|nr:unnamed protein product [Colias eurytheme]